MGHSAAECRSCQCLQLCDDWTLSEQERRRHDEGQQDMDYTVLTGMCDACLESHGPDDDCMVPDEQDEAEVRAEREYRNLDRGEL